MPDDDDARSIREMADADAEQQTKAELFPIGSLDGDETTLGQLIRGNHSVEVTVSMGSAEVPVRGGGLLDVNREHLLLVTVEPRKIEVVPKREGDRVEGKEIVGYKLRQGATPIFVERVHGEAGAIEAAFIDLLREDETAAAALLERVTRRTEQALGATA